MKKILFIIVLVIISGVFCSLQAQTERIKAQETKTNKKVKLKGERIFIKYAEKCLDVMEQTAKDNSVKGVAIISFIPGDQTESWVSRMKVIGALSSPKANFLGIASASLRDGHDPNRFRQQNKEPTQWRIGIQRGCHPKSKRWVYCRGFFRRSLRN